VIDRAPADILNDGGEYSLAEASSSRIVPDRIYSQPDSPVPSAGKPGGRDLRD
jgi:hypothetical protein